MSTTSTEVPVAETRSVEVGDLVRFGMVHHVKAAEGKLAVVTNVAPRASVHTGSIRARTLEPTVNDNGHENVGDPGWTSPNWKPARVFSWHPFDGEQVPAQDRVALPPVGKKIAFRGSGAPSDWNVGEVITHDVGDPLMVMYVRPSAGGGNRRWVREWAYLDEADEPPVVEPVKPVQVGDLIRSTAEGIPHGGRTFPAGQYLEVAKVHGDGSVNTCLLSTPPESRGHPYTGPALGQDEFVRVQPTTYATDHVGANTGEFDPATLPPIGSKVIASFRSAEEQDQPDVHRPVDWYEATVKSHDRNDRRLPITAAAPALPHTTYGNWVYAWVPETVDNAGGDHVSADTPDESPEDEDEVASLRRQLLRSQREHLEFRQQVVEVATRYAKAHKMCEVVDAALSEMGLEATSPQKVRFTVEQTITRTIEVVATPKERQIDGADTEFVRMALTVDESDGEPSLDSDWDGVEDWDVTGTSVSVQVTNVEDEE